MDQRIDVVTSPEDMTLDSLALIAGTIRAPVYLVEEVDGAFKASPVGLASYENRVLLLFTPAAALRAIKHDSSVPLLSR